MEVDRLSELPDALIHQILSSLNTKERVRTRSLSKRWRGLFSSILTLDYCFRSILGDRFDKGRHCQYYINIVDGLLRLSKPTHVRLLHLDFFIGKATPSIPDQWLPFAAGLSSVTDLVVCLHGYGHWTLNSDRFRPSVLSLFRILSSVRSLTLDQRSLSGFPWPGTPFWGVFKDCYFGCLKSLSLSKVCLSEKDFESMLDLCPPLESIRVDYISRLMLSGRNAYRLKTLDVCVHGDVELGPAVELQFPPLRDDFETTTCVIDEYHPLNHLKTINVMYFSPRKAGMQLIKFLLRRAVVLEKFHVPMLSHQSLEILKSLDDLDFGDHDFERFPGLFDDVKSLNLENFEEPINGTIIAGLRYFRCLEELSKFPAKYLVDIDFKCFPGLFNNIKSLNLHLCDRLRSHSGKPTYGTVVAIVAGLRHFQHLENLSIEYNHLEEQRNGMAITGAMEGYYSLNHLKTIQVRSFCPEEAGMQLLKLLLRSAVVLERFHMSVCSEHAVDIFKYVNDFDLERFPGMFDNVKSLNLYIPSQSVELTNGIIADGLQHFRHLDNIGIFYTGDKRNGRTCAIDGRYALNHLKEINMWFLSGIEEEIQLVEFLLRTAVVLEKIYFILGYGMEAEHVKQV
ncbi:F-box/LRR-repeat protein [Acorus gramineus]|uniref:F-box/LRR-repeat protein n=1 Tax=Acorus gramineus TaxID=55184 RepID=A0AAV9B278_ACOGR|nr:F-box/LRR-repeat protein [Acorus gramineus]